MSSEMWSSVEPLGGCSAGGGGGGGGAAPCARGKHSATLLGGHVYVLGGRGGGGAVPLRDFWRYTLESGVWERLASRGEAPPSLQEHSATAHGHKLYVFGGEATALSGETPLWIYDTESGFWRKLTGQASAGAGSRRGRRGARGSPGAGGAGGPSGRRGHSAHALKDCLLIYGGYKDLRGSTNELWAFHYECESWQQVRTSTGACAGPARHRHAAALHDARLYVHAGQCDLRQASDLWTYDTISRVWSQVRAAGKASASPGARAGHAAVRAGTHLYIFGGDADGCAAADMWRFHFATEMWERIIPSMRWPAARVDACALLVPRAATPCAPAPAPRVAGRGEAGRGAAAAGTLLSRLSSLRVRRAERGRCAYSALGERDSTESLPPARDSPLINKSRSAHHLTLSMSRRQPADGADSETMPRDPLSVPDFADCLDSDEEGDTGRRRRPPDEEGDLSTSDYASAERVNRIVCVGFSNPHYLGPDVRALGARAGAGAALTPDSGVQGGDIEMQELRAPPQQPRRGLQLLLVGGREAPHVARLQGPLSMWAYSLL